MNRITFFAAVSAAALLLSTLPAFAQANQGGGFVTLDLNWSDAGAPPESELDGDTMRQILERDQARVRMIQERTKAKAPAIKPGLVKDDVQKADGKPLETVTAPVAPPDSSRMRSLSADQMRQIVERDRARAKAMGERIRGAQIEAEAEKYIKEHPGEFTPGKTPAGWLDNFTAAVGKSKADKKPILALFTGSDWCPPCQNLEKNILLQPAFKNFAEKHLVTLFLDFPREAKLDDGVKKQNDSLAAKFSVEAYPTILILSSDGQKELWKQVGYTPLFLEQLQNAVKGLDKDFPETAKAVKEELEAENKAKAEEKAAKEKAELEEIEKQQKELEEARRKQAAPGSGIVNPAVMNPWGAGRINRRGDNPLDQLSDEEREALFRELDGNGPIQGPDVLPNGGPAPLRNHVKRD
ncbi:MAG: thioredoxin family protein [Lentisphaeria bacterium]|nr:thioredoxin family protein [Lentisphaeria bacterium]